MMNDEVISNETEKKLIRRHREVQRHEEYQYLHLLEDIMEDGIQKDDRTGIGTKSIFGTQLKFDLQKGFPLLTTKKTFLRGIFEELMWFIRGETDSNLLEEKKVNIWKGNTTREFLDNRGLHSYPEGEAGPIYGFQYRNFNGTYRVARSSMEETRGKEFIFTQTNGVDQLAKAIDLIKTDPNSRRILVSAWNPQQLEQMALEPCHILYQFNVVDDKLHCQWTQRSVDTFLGLPFNIASYALLTHMVAKVTGYDVGTLTFSGGDTHIYNNHIDQVREQLTRTPYKFPTIEINKDLSSIEDMESLEHGDILLENYECHPAIKAPMAV
jgi:thymidylate synthase